ncbi:type III secretion system effector protein [Xylophilus ampelinus]|nr:type III secretion system effector protein [Xylophilus ampelinus]
MRAQQPTEERETLRMHAARPAASMSPAEASLARLGEQLSADNQRPVEPRLAADLVNAFRPMKLPGARGDPGRAATHADLSNRIGTKDVALWYQAQGLGEHDVSKLRRSALLSGLPNPTGSFMNNAMQYIASPWILYATGIPWAGAGFGFATAAIAAPMNAAQQSAVVTLCESIREHGGYVIVPDKQQINDRHWLPDLAKSLENHLQEFDACCARFRELQHAAEAVPSEEAQTRLVAAAGSLLEAEACLVQAQQNFVMTQGAHDRQWKGNRWQSIPRTLRSPLASTLGLLGKTGAMGPVSQTAQIAGALLMTAAQHVAAGFDEQAKQDCNNLLNLLYADIFTVSGKQKFARGEPVGEEDIDTGKLRRLIQSPTQALVKRVTAEVKSREKTLAAELAAPAPPNAAADADDVDLELGHGTGSAKTLNLLREDFRALREGRLDALAPDGLAASLLLGAENSVLSDQLARDIAKKYTSREFSAQTAQRIGQMFHLGVLGSATSSVMGKATSAAQGGARAIPVQQTVGIAAMSGAMAAVGALNQHTAITVKNNRREGETDIGLGRQIIRGVTGGAIEAMAQRRASQASKAINVVLDDSESAQLLQNAKSLALSDAALSSRQAAPTLTLAEAVAGLRPGVSSHTQSPHVVIEIKDIPRPKPTAP